MLGEFPSHLFEIFWVLPGWRLDIASLLLPIPVEGAKEPGKVYVNASTGLESPGIPKAIGAIGQTSGATVQGFSYGPLLWDPLILVGSVLWAPILYMVYSWYILESRLGTHTEGP